MKWRMKGKQFDSLGNHFSNKNIYIYGAGDAGSWTYDRLRFLDAVDAFVDADCEKQRRLYQNKPVISPNVLYKEHDQKHIIIVAIRDEDIANNIIYRLMCAGYVRGYDVFWFSDFVPKDDTGDYKDGFYLRIYSVYAKSKIWLDSTAIFPSSICNLKCKYCLAFTPHIKNHRIKTLEQCMEEVDLFFKWVDYVRWFQISGGEPQLWKSLPDLVAYIGSKYRDRIGQRFEIVTNGTIQPSEELLVLMSKYKMDMCIDDYGINYGNLENHAIDIVEQVKRMGIDYIYDKPEKWVNIVNNVGASLEESHKDLESWFDECGLPFHANEFGRIYTCSYGSFAIKAGIIRDSEDEFFDLHQDITDCSKKEFVEFSLGYSEKGYSHFCKQCNGWVESVNNTYVSAAVQE